MQWFKHMSDMSFDPKVKRVIRKYGVDGYGLYCYVLESIARGLSETSPYPELEEMAEDIAADLKMDSRRIEEIMMFMVHQGLFDWRDASDRIVCMKMIDYLDEYHRKAGKSSSIRKALQEIELRHCPDKLLTNSGDVAKNREEEEKNREEKSMPKRKRFVPPTIEEITPYCQEKGVDPHKWHDHYTANGWMVGRNKMKDWKAAVRTWARNDYAKPGENADTAEYASPPPKIGTCRHCNRENQSLQSGLCPDCRMEGIK